MTFYERFISSSIRDLKSTNLYRSLLAEMLGTLLLVFITTMSVASTNDLVGISLCFGLAVASIVWALAHVSGGHINPAVSFGMLVTRKISLARCLLYVIAQCVGGLIGSATTQALSCSWQSRQASYETCVLGVTELGKGVTQVQGFAVEMIITYVLVFVVFATCDSARSDLKGSGPLAIGLSVTLCHLAAIPLTGSSMNTARSFGPAVVSNSWSNHWIYWIGPITGGVMAALMYELIFAGNASLMKFADWLVESEYERPAATKHNSEGKFHKMRSQPLLPLKKRADADLHLLRVQCDEFVETRA